MLSPAQQGVVPAPIQISLVVWFLDTLCARSLVLEHRLPILPFFIGGGVTLHERLVWKSDPQPGNRPLLNGNTSSVGWAMAAVLDGELVEHALEMALRRRHPQSGLLHHSDRGCQYSSQEYQDLMRSHGIRVSMSRKGNCYDNAVMERFFGTLKGECVTRCVFETHEQAQHVVFAYVECFYNRLRSHSSLGYLSPAQFEQLNSSSLRFTLLSKRVNNTTLLREPCTNGIQRERGSLWLLLFPMSSKLPMLYSMPMMKS